jgi:hypothetical protein
VKQGSEPNDANDQLWHKPAVGSSSTAARQGVDATSSLTPPAETSSAHERARAR